MPSRHPSGDAAAAASHPSRVSPSTTPADLTDPRGLLERVPAILYTADPGRAGRWHYVSPQIEQILGFTPEEWCADPHLWARQLHRDDAEQQFGVEAELAAGADIGSLNRPSEYRIHHRDGRIVWLRDDAQLVEEADGRCRWHGVMSDITERKLVEAELERQVAQQSAVARLGERALEGLGTGQLIREALRAVTDVVGIDFAAVTELVVDETGVSLRLAESVPGLPAAVPDVVGRDSQAGYTLLHGGPVLVADWATEERFARPGAIDRLAIRSGLSVTIEGRRGPFGVLGLHARTARTFTQADIAFAQSVANLLGDALERQLTDDDIRHRALHDPLTGLPNRALFVDRLQQSVARLRRHRRQLSAVLALDLDRFTLLNDSLGHAIGDELLAATGPRLKRALRATDTVARFGADKFGVLLEEISGEGDAIEMAQRIGAVFTRPFLLAGDEHFITTSIGIALAEGGEQADDLIRDADAAMHRAKERGGGRYELFDERLRGRAISRLRVENDLRRALERDELVLDYQPVVSLQDGALVSVEALVRWEHPERGRIAPSDFIPVAEQTGLIGPIGRWVLEHACRQASHWYRDRPDAAPLTMSVNLSAVQVADRSLPDTVAESLRGAGLDPACLTLELTESVMVGDADGLAEALTALKQIGVRLVLDDFGTGYSSLSYLTRLPLDALKVDRSFVDGLGTESGDTAITEAIVAMSHALSLQVVGEGAETELQVSELARLGCDLAQGYHFSRPVPAAEISEMLANGPAWR